MREIYCEQSNFDLSLLVVHPSHISSHQHQRRHPTTKWRLLLLMLPYRFDDAPPWDEIATERRLSAHWLGADGEKNRSSSPANFDRGAFLNKSAWTQTNRLLLLFETRKQFSYSYTVTIKDDLGTLNPDPNCLWWETGCVHLLFSGLGSVRLESSSSEGINLIINCNSHPTNWRLSTTTTVRWNQDSWSSSFDQPLNWNGFQEAPKEENWLNWVESERPHFPSSC